jgi:SAM-dependent methyltransferase
MQKKADRFENYFRHLNKLSIFGWLYHRLYKLPLLFFILRYFGPRMIEVGSGIGNGVLGIFSSNMKGVDINPQAVEYCRNIGLDVHLINENESYPFDDGEFDACLLDNVLEHIKDTKSTLDECWRITSRNGGLVVVVPGFAGFKFDKDHKVFYDEIKLRRLDHRWVLISLFSIPFVIRNKRISKIMRQYCLVAVYKKQKVS